MKKIYLASPYSHQEREVRFMRYIHACRAAALLMQSGLNVFSPIAHSHAVAEFMPRELLLDFEFWMEQDLDYIRRWADEVWVLMLPGHAESRGVAREMEVAHSHAKPVRWLTLDDAQDMFRAHQGGLKAAAEMVKGGITNAAERLPDEEDGCWDWRVERTSHLDTGAVIYNLSVKRIGIAYVAKATLTPATDDVQSGTPYHFLLGGARALLYRDGPQLGLRHGEVGGMNIDAALRTLERKLRGLTEWRSS